MESAPHTSNAILRPFKNYVYLDATYNLAPLLTKIQYIMLLEASLT